MNKTRFPSVFIMITAWQAHANLSIISESTNNCEGQEMGLLYLHLLQSSMVYINTLMIQEVLEETKLTDKMTPRDLAALSPLFTLHINPYGRFELDMEARLQLTT